MKRIAILTSGGDAPGMNSVIRAAVRTGIDRGLEVYGVRHGYSGLIEGDIHNLGPRDVGGIMQHGGTVLGSARCPEFETEPGRLKAMRELNRKQIEALVVVGGNGSQTGALALLRQGFPVVGVASTIDNDLAGSEITLGVDTALNIALEAIDRLKTTASSHQLAFLVEVMGRKCGSLALMAGVAGGAEVILIPEVEFTPEEVARELRQAYERGKPHAIAVVAEGAAYNASALQTYFSAPRSPDRLSAADDHPGPRAARRRPFGVRSLAGGPLWRGSRRGDSGRQAGRSGRDRSQPDHDDRTGGDRWRSQAARSGAAGAGTRAVALQVERAQAASPGSSGLHPGAASTSQATA